MTKRLHISEWLVCVTKCAGEVKWYVAFRMKNVVVEHSNLTIIL